MLEPVHIVTVPLGERSYSIRIGPGLLAQTGRHCRRLGLGTRAAVITDANVGPLYAARLERSLGDAGFDPVRITVPAGESSKTLAMAQFCYDRLAAHRLERRSFVVALGGGVVGDLAGFVAATYLRGIALVQAPTSLLAQVDSSVGGKVGVNLKRGKNLVGAFYQPRAVFCDLAALRTLPEREYRSGLAEVIKYGIIRDGAFFSRLERALPELLARRPRALASVIAHCCAIKAAVVGRDETETGLRAILNYGHTIGHALEAIFGYRRFLHGEAIAIGQAAAARISHLLAGLSGSEVRRIEALFGGAGLPTVIRLTGRQWARFLAAMQLDKKVAGGEVGFVLAPRIGRVITGQRVTAPVIRGALQGSP